MKKKGRTYNHRAANEHSIDIEGDGAFSDIPQAWVEGGNDGLQGDGCTPNDKAGWHVADACFCGPAKAHASENAAGSHLQRHREKPIAIILKLCRCQTNHAWPD